MEIKAKHAAEQMLEQLNKPAPAEAPTIKPELPAGRVEPTLPGAELMSVSVSKLEVSQGVDGIFSTFELSLQGGAPGQFQAYLHPETLAIDKVVYSTDQFPTAHEGSVNRQIQDHCREQGIEPLYTLQGAQDWVSKTLGGDFKIRTAENGAGFHLHGAGGVWTQNQDTISGVLDRVENRLVNDTEFLRDVGRAVGYPQRMMNDRGDLDYRHSAYVKSKIEAALETRPDEISRILEERSRENSQNLSKVVSIKM